VRSPLYQLFVGKKGGLLSERLLIRFSGCKLECKLEGMLEGTRLRAPLRIRVRLRVRLSESVEMREGGEQHYNNVRV
jgi:hypothetical protein